VAKDKIMNEKDLTDFDKYFTKWWLNNQHHFSYQIDNEILCDDAVKTICALDAFLNGHKWEMSGSLVALLHGYFKKEG
jgi:hypothetical protein